MTESDLWDKLQSVVKEYDPGADLTRHEDRLSLGTPDVSFGIKGVGGWTELKAYKNWPRDSGQPLPFANLKPQQRLWIRRRGRAGAPVTLLVVVGTRQPEFLLFDWRTVQDLGTLTREELRKVAVWRSERRLEASIAPALMNPTARSPKAPKRRITRTG